MNKRDLKKFRAALEQKRDSIVNAPGKKPHWENMEDTRHGDFVDQASDDNEVHVNLRLLQIDAKLLRAIEAESTTAPTASVPSAKRKSAWPGSRRFPGPPSASRAKRRRPPDPEVKRPDPAPPAGGSR